MPRRPDPSATRTPISRGCGGRRIANAAGRFPSRGQQSRASRDRRGGLARGNRLKLGELEGSGLAGLGVDAEDVFDVDRAADPVAESANHDFGTNAEIEHDWHQGSPRLKLWPPLRAAGRFSLGDDGCRTSRATMRIRRPDPRRA